MASVVLVSANFQCDEIISGTKGINIDNSDEPIIIDANYIEGSNGNDGVINSASGSNYVLRNAKIKEYQYIWGFSLHLHTIRKFFY